MSTSTALILVAFVAVTSSVSPAGVSKQPTTSTCTAADRDEGRASRNAPPVGIDLLLGVQTGMTSDEVKQRDKLLIGNRPRGRFELVVGIRLPAMVNIWGKPARSVSVEMNGKKHFRSIVAALTERFGEPLQLSSPPSYIDVPISITGGTKLVDVVRLKWCDGPRQVIISGEPEDFWVSISARD